jgi:hypothetical protein
MLQKCELGNISGYFNDPGHYKRWRKFPKKFDWWYGYRWNHDSVVDFDLVPKPKGHLN